jgi:outer membrane protein assembly factor BamD (BamD/ComL family)
LAIRQALRSSQALTALKLLDDAQRRFGNGVLGEEREALRIEALAHTGNRTQAASRAKAFLSAHPRSPHASDVRRYLAE